MSAPTPEDVVLAQQLYARWDQGKGESKSALERDVWNDGKAHGRHFDRFVRETLGLGTTKPSKQTDRIGGLERQVRRSGRIPSGTHAPVWEVQLQHARASALSALRIWNDPSAEFRAGGFALLFVAAWNSLAIAVLERRGEQWRQLDEHENPISVHGHDYTLDTGPLIDLAFPGPIYQGLRANMSRWVQARNLVAHRCLPPLDIAVIPLAQAGLLNFENVLAAEFGDDYLLGEMLSVPLQLSGFRDPGIMHSLKQLQAMLPLDVQAFLTQLSAVPDDLLADPTYQLRVAFIPVVPNSGRSPDAVAYFLKPGEVPDALANELTQYIVLPKYAASTPRPNLGAKAVAVAVEAAIPYKFNRSHHLSATRSLGIRPPADEPDESKTDPAYCEWVPAAKLYLYNDAWVNRLVQEVQTEDGFLKTTGRSPVPKPSD